MGVVSRLKIYRAVFDYEGLSFAGGLMAMYAWRSYVLAWLSLQFADIGPT
jgi:hypothetical protein